MKSPFEELEKIAESVARDIAGDFPEMDTGYNLYVEKLERKLAPHDTVEITYGLIDMGDAFQSVYHWVEQDRYDNQEWIQVNEDPGEIEDEILRKRGAL